jgi:CBS domain-containing protein
MTRDRQPAVVGDLMAVDPIVIGANAGLTEAAALLDHHHIHGAPVVDNAGSLVGVLSQTDLLRARSTEYLWANWPGLAVRHLMTSPAVTVTRSTQIVTAATMMERHRIHRLVVVADNDPALPIGVLSTTDLLHAIVGAAEEPTGEPAGEPAEAAIPEQAGEPAEVSADA